ncbi:MAG: hypothetical protein IKZ13_05750 [Akkermansia sp.]|nr:hypothetical protein [Akkermansia sp.]
MSLALAERFGSVPINSGILQNTLKDYRSPRARIQLLERRGELISLRRDLYVCNTAQGYSHGLIANHLLGPSYVSYETVLAEAGIIPERVYSIRSSCLARSRSFDNATGHYEYTQVPAAYFAVGIRSVQTEQGYYYLSATPEKALCDLILATPGLRLQTPKAAREYAEIYLRADMEAIAGMNADLIAACAEAAHKKNNDLKNLEKFIRHEQQRF